MRVTVLFLLALGLALTGCPDTPTPPAAPSQPAAPAAPPNYVIDTSTGDLAKILRKLATHVTIHGQISKPTKGWPEGINRAEVHLDGILADTKKFSID